MSAFLVNDKHISVLVRAAKRPSMGVFHWYFDGQDKSLTDDKIQYVGQLLVNQNYKSVNHRYEEGRKPHEFSMVPDRNHTHEDAVQVLKAIQCYAYQSCEDPEWEKSEAFAFVKALEHAMIQKLPGYSDKKWEIT